MYEEYKELERLYKLHDAYNKQKKRTLQLLEIDCKRLGTRLVARELGFNLSYLYKLFSPPYSISFEQIIDIYKKVQEIKKIVIGDDDEKDNG